MTVKDYLSRYHHMVHTIERMKAEVAEYERLAATIPGCNFDVVRVEGTKSNDAPFVKWIHRALDKEQEIEALTKKLIQVKKEIISVIDKLDNTEYKRVLIHRYIDWQSWNEIAAIMYCSSATIRRWHDKAILEIMVPKNEQG